MKTLRNAGIAGIISIALAIIAITILVIEIVPHFGDEAALNQALQKIYTPLLNIPWLIIGIILVILIFSGLISLGKRFNSKLLVSASWISLIILIAYNLYTNLSLLFKTDFITKTPADTIISLLFLIIISVLMLLIGIGLIKIRKKVELANVTGILYIVTAGLFITLIGAVLGAVSFLAAAITQIIMFFKASKKFEK